MCLSQTSATKPPPREICTADIEIDALGNGKVRAVTIARVGEGVEAEQAITGSAVVLSTSRGA